MYVDLKTLTAKPHRLFFALGALLAIVSIAVFLLAKNGYIDVVSPPSYYHAATIMLTVFPAFFWGFLFTVFPRFLFSEEIGAPFFQTIAALLALCGLLFITSLFVAGLDSAALLFATLLHGAVFYKLYLIYSKSRLAEKSEMGWMLVALASTIAGGALMTISTLTSTLARLFAVGESVGLFMGLFMLIFTIAQRMIPFFTESAVGGYSIKKSKKLLPSVFVLLIFATLFESAELKLFAAATFALLFALLCREMYIWRLPVFRANFMLQSLYAGLFWAVAAFGVMATDRFVRYGGDTALLEKGGVHILGIGFFASVLISFGSRVALGHSGKPIAADRWIVSLFWGVQGVLVLRLAAEIFFLDGVYGTLINASGALWCVVFTVWLIRFWPNLTKESA